MYICVNIYREKYISPWFVSMELAVILDFRALAKVRITNR